MNMNNGMYLIKHFSYQRRCTDITWSKGNGQDGMQRVRIRRRFTLDAQIPRSKRQKAKSSSRTMARLFSRVFKLYTPPRRWYAYPFRLHSVCSRNICSQLVDLSAAQDIEAGDGTTSVVVLAGSLLGAAEKMLEKGIHPTIISEAFSKAATKAVEYLTEISTPVDLNDRASLLRAATTSLNSKVGDMLLTLYLD